MFLVMYIIIMLTIIGECPVIIVETEAALFVVKCSVLVGYGSSCSNCSSRLLSNCCSQSINSKTNYKIYKI